MSAVDLGPIKRPRRRQAGARTSRTRRCGAVDMKRRAGVVGLRVDELESEGRREIFEEGQALSERHRLQDEAVFVDEPEAGEGLREGGATQASAASLCLRPVGDLRPSAPAFGLTLGAFGAARAINAIRPP